MVDTVAALAQARAFDEAWLRGQGVEDLEHGGVGILYMARDGGFLFRRRRGAPGSFGRFEQPKGVGLRPYGLWHLDDWLNHMTAPVVYLTEGESDAWALWAAGFPALGLPGSGAFACLRAEDLAGIEHLHVVPDADQAGKDLLAGLRRHLGWLRFSGTLHVVGLPPGVKDVCELRRRDPAGFAARFAELAGRAEPVLLERPAGSDNGQAGSHHAARVPEAPFEEPIPASKLRGADPSLSWIWKGFLRRGEVTLLAALWKSGKTTLLAHLLRAMGTGGPFLGLDLTPSKVLYVTEESEPRWAARRDALGLGDHVHFLVRPFATRPRMERWVDFLTYLDELVAANGYDVVILDTLANLWPLKDENDACAMQAALMPLNAMTARAALLIVHHTRKSDGSEATASRGSGALTSFVATIIEFRRYLPAERADRRRVLSCYGRDDETPAEVVVELGHDGYRAQGDRATVQRRELADEIAAILPPRPPGYNTAQVAEALQQGPSRQKLLAVLRDGVERGVWQSSGRGRKGDPYLYWLAGPHDSVFGASTPIGDNAPETAT
jgi:hypothetical protein